MKYFSLFSSLILYREIVSNTSENISLLISEGSGTANKKTLSTKCFLHCKIQTRTLKKLQEIAFKLQQNIRTPL